MLGSRPSLSAQYVAVVRSLLTSMGVVDDPYAAAMLRPAMRPIAWVLRRPPLSGWTRSGFFAALAARTLSFDDQVSRAIAEGLDQIAVIGAGYDSRAWRMATPDVRFFEVDHPSTQEDKRRRAPSGGPTYIAHDLTAGPVLAALTASGFDPARPAVFVVEGVTMYLARADVVGLLSGLAQGAAPGSRLAVNFSPPADTAAPRDRRRQRLFAIIGTAGGERFRFSIEVEEAGSLVASTGWTVTATRTLKDIGTSLLGASPLPADQITAGASIVVATLAK